MIKTVAATIFIAVLFLIVTDGSASTRKHKEMAQGSFKVNLPEGLYMYKPYTRSGDLFAALFVVEKGRLVEPNAFFPKGYRDDPEQFLGKEEAKAFEGFVDKYVKGNAFNVYAGAEFKGRLSGVEMNLSNFCYTDEFFPDIIGSGKYEGDHVLVESDEDSSLYIFNTLEREFGALKSTATPLSFERPQTNQFEVTEDDKAKAVEAVRRDLLPEASERIQGKLDKENRVIRDESGSRLNILKAIDIDGNGKKELLGIYTINVSHNKEDDKNKIIPARAFSEVLFILWDSGKIEMIFSEEFMTPAFSLIGLFDIDDDGIHELAIQRFVASLKEPDGGDGRQIVILRHDPAGWKAIYSSSWICGDYK
ncbi:hypothetical protein BAC1_02325 [uncultured bacterium]|nr:hypothetical protein BAC1_02325 [uncultured bacterium]